MIALGVALALVRSGEVLGEILVVNCSPCDWVDAVESRRVWGIVDLIGTKYSFWEDWLTALLIWILIPLIHALYSFSLGNWRCEIDWAVHRKAVLDQWPWENHLRSWISFCVFLLAHEAFASWSLLSWYDSVLIRLLLYTFARCHRNLSSLFWSIHG